jgi:hypothetical protein
MDLLSAFESIGDNCEFGLIQKIHGIDEGSLLKWARILDVNHLIKLLANNFKDLYLFDNILPRWDDMVEDKEYGFWFHSDLRSEIVNGERRWLIESEEERRQIFEAEYQKRLHLVDKLRINLSTDAKIFVFKMNADVGDEDVFRLSQALGKYGKTRLLYVRQSHGAETPLGVTPLSEGLWRATIPRFAPYWPVENFLPGAWEKLCEETYGIIGRA